MKTHRCYTCNRKCAIDFDPQGSKPEQLQCELCYPFAIFDKAAKAIKKNHHAMVNNLRADKRKKAYKTSRQMERAMHVASQALMRMRLGPEKAEEVLGELQKMQDAQEETQPPETIH